MKTALQCAARGLVRIGLVAKPFDLSDLRTIVWNAVDRRA